MSNALENIYFQVLEFLFLLFFNNEFYNSSLMMAWGPRLPHEPP